MASILSSITVLSIVLAMVLSVNGKHVNTHQPSDANTHQPSDENTRNPSEEIDTSSPTSAPTSTGFGRYEGDYDNVLMIVLDQLRYDTLGFVQSSMDRYADSFKIRTPNIDSLAAQGVAFRTAYSQSNSCAPARGTIKTGYTVARHGLSTNSIIDERVYGMMETVKSKIERIRTLEESLRFNLGYTVETYGKWHFPQNQYGPIQRNYYDYATDEFSLWPDQTFKPLFQSALAALPSTPACVFQSGDQVNTYSDCAYTPLPNDPRYGMPAQTPESELPGFLRGNELGEDSLDVNHTSTAILADMGLRALDRIMNDPNSGPFLLSIHFNAPHPPRIAAEPYLEYYLANQDQLWVPPSLYDPMNFSAYNSNAVTYVNDTAYELIDEGFVRDFTAVYYAMIEEVDTQIGRIMERLQQSEDVYKKTLIVFTSDHGEMMGSHGATGKGNLLEESTRVPLILVHPSKIPAGREVQVPVSQLDLVSSVLDYANSPAETDTSDGTSLRRYIDRASYNAEHDEGAVVVEADNRRPVSSTELGPDGLGMLPNFMVRHGSHKLMVPRSARSPVPDMLYDVGSDPYEMNNLLGTSPDDPAVIGKAEHLKILLVEWLERHDTEHRYFSSNAYHAGEGRGDVTEVRRRRTWAPLAYWQSDSTLRFGGPAVLADGEYRRNEYLYVGGADLEVTGATVEGADASYFDAQIDVTGDGYVRIKVSFSSSSSEVSIASLDAWVVVANSATTTSIVPIEG